MPRISQIDTIDAADLSEALEWFHGDTSLLEGIVEDDDGNPVDLSGAAITARAEFYDAAKVEYGGKRNSDLFISGFTAASQAHEDLTVTIDADQAANPGEFTLAIPANLLAANPGLDLESDVPCAVVYVQRTEGTEIRTARTLIVFRRGRPA